MEEKKDEKLDWSIGSNIWNFIIDEKHIKEEFEVMFANDEISDKESVKSMPINNEVKDLWPHLESNTVPGVPNVSTDASTTSTDCNTFYRRTGTNPFPIPGPSAFEQDEKPQETDSNFARRMKEKSEELLRKLRNEDYSYNPRRAGRNSIGSLYQASQTGHYSEESSDYCKPPDYPNRVVQDQEDEQYRFLRGINRMKSEDQ